MHRRVPKHLCLFYSTIHWWDGAFFIGWHIRNWKISSQLMTYSRKAELKRSEAALWICDINFCESIYRGGRALAWLMRCTNNDRWWTWTVMCASREGVIAPSSTHHLVRIKRGANRFTTGVHNGTSNLLHFKRKRACRKWRSSSGGGPALDQLRKRCERSL